MTTKKSKKEIQLLKEGGAMLAAILREAAKRAKPGVTTEEIDAFVEESMREKGGEPAFKGYRPSGAAYAYPAATCMSVNEVVVHGLPSDYELQSGDVLKIDAGLIYRSLYTDTAITVAVGKVGKEEKKLMKTTKKALDLGIAQAKIGNTTGDIGYAIGSYIEKKGFKVIRNLTGHGVGYAVHEDPIIYNFGQPGGGVLLEEGMVIALEPMVSVGSEYTIQMRDDSYATADGSQSAHYEHTLAITKNGPLILTRP